MAFRSSFALVLMAAACGERPVPPLPEAGFPAASPPPATAQPGGAPEVMLRGVVRLEPRAMFRSCDLEVHAAFHDSTSDRLIPTYRLLGTSEETGLYMLVRAEFTSSREVVLREIEYAGIPSPDDGCDAPAPSYRLIARGIRPDWRVTVDDRALEFAQDTVRLTFPSQAGRDSADATIYEATASTPGPHRLRLVVQGGGCNEGNTGYGSMAAELEVDGRVFTGCAWRGRLR